KIVAVISDKEDAPGFLIAQQKHIQTLICQKKEQLLTLLTPLQPHYLCLAGWKQIIPEEVLSHYPKRILNIHPGLIPDSLGSIVTNPDGTDALWNRGKFTDLA